MDNLINQIKTELPYLRILEMDGGVNIYTDHGVITVWFRKYKYCNSLQNNKWRHYLNINDLIDIIKETHEQKRVIPIRQEILATPSVQQCIDHLNKKADTIFKAGSKPELATLLKTTAQELTQYL